MKTLKTTLLPFLVIALSSCAFHSGTMNYEIPNKPVVHKDFVLGVSQSSKFLVFGGVAKDALISEARQNLIETRPLEGFEQYNNIVIDVKNVYFIIGSKTKVTITADIIEPKDSVNQETYSQDYLAKTNYYSNYKDSIFQVGDTIYRNKDGDIGLLISFEGECNKKVRIQYTSKRGNLKTTLKNRDKVFFIRPQYNDLELNQKYNGLGLIIGFSKKGVLLRLNELIMFEKY
jgi:hypothetical protein